VAASKSSGNAYVTTVMKFGLLLFAVLLVSADAKGKKEKVKVTEEPNACEGKNTEQLLVTVKIERLFFSSLCRGSWHAQGTTGQKRWQTSKGRKGHRKILQRQET
jgi:hypothetical protein